MHRVERSQDEDRVLGEYWDKFDASQARINAALRRAKEDMRHVLVTLEVFLQGELVIHDLDPRGGELSGEIADEFDTRMVGIALDVLDIIRDRVERLEAGS